MLMGGMVESLRGFYSGGGDGNVRVLTHWELKTLLIGFALLFFKFNHQCSFVQLNWIIKNSNFHKNSISFEKKSSFFYYANRF